VPRHHEDELGGRTAGGAPRLDEADSGEAGGSERPSLPDERKRPAVRRIPDEAGLVGAGGTRPSAEARHTRPDPPKAPRVCRGRMPTNADHPPPPRGQRPLPGRARTRIPTAQPASPTSPQTHRGCSFGQECWFRNAVNRCDRTGAQPRGLNGPLHAPHRPPAANRARKREIDGVVGWAKLARPRQPAGRPTGSARLRQRAVDGTQTRHPRDARGHRSRPPLARDQENEPTTRRFPRWERRPIGRGRPSGRRNAETTTAIPARGRASRIRKPPRSSNHPRRRRAQAARRWVERAGICCGQPKGPTLVPFAGPAASASALTIGARLRTQRRRLPSAAGVCRQ